MNAMNIQKVELYISRAQELDTPENIEDVLRRCRNVKASVAELKPNSYKKKIIKQHTIEDMGMDEYIKAFQKEIIQRVLRFLRSNMSVEAFLKTRILEYSVVRKIIVHALQACEVQNEVIAKVIQKSRSQVSNFSHHYQPAEKILKLWVSFIEPIVNKYPKVKF